VAQTLKVVSPVDGSVYAEQPLADRRDLDAAVSIGEQIDTGTWFMNRCDCLDPALAWVGVKDSGRGCPLSRIGFERLTRAKSYPLKTETTP